MSTSAVTRTPTSPPDRDRRVLGGYLLSLDGVRGLAILMVLAHNLNVLTGPQTPAGQAVSRIDDLGWVGVQLFFVLSGFLITGILLDTRESDNYYRAFLGRRVLRIFPLYYGTLAVAFVVLPLVSSHHPPPDGQIWLWAAGPAPLDPHGRAGGRQDRHRVLRTSRRRGRGLAPPHGAPSGGGAVVNG